MTDIQYKPKTRLIREHKIPFYIIDELIRDGKVAVHLINGKAVIDVQEALRAREQRKAALRPVKIDLFAAAS